MSRDQIPLLVVLVPVLIVAIWLKGVQADKHPGARRNVALR